MQMQTNTELSVIVLRRKKNVFREIWKYKQLMLMILPAFIYFVIFRYGPIFGVAIAFKDFRPMAGRSFWDSIIQSPWVGLKNFEDFFTSMNGIQILKNTVIISMLKILIGFPASIVLALLFNEIANIKMKKIFQTITYLPYFFSWVVLAGIIRIVFSPDNGVIIPILHSLGLPAINLIGDARFFRGLLVGSDIWQSVGYGAIIYLAALAGADEQLYEAAKIDGAGKMKQLLHITLPAISSTIVIMLILRTGTILNGGFDQVFNLYNPAVYSVGDIIDTHIYTAGLINMRFSYTTAVGVFQSFIGFIMVIFTNIVAKRLGQEGIL